ncbi:GH25 family lysozyme [Caproiciproducens galactitolivorans]|uniref:Autolytic lysozyme n=1 Tax=Caproiciproducens galactitolivorans TaxID=642589 RepID=A0A4Z0YBK2_9FIRM|nr:GH25 family lysozyme [Caproiciproducens galactitolivorans]TGJ76845.1 autolytic lysozyme [Caproiciproducens galactitolivorans]
MRKRCTALLLALTFALSMCTMAYADTTASALALSAQSLALKRGETASLTVSDGSSVTWTSSNPNVASVSDGTVTGVSLGRATVTATAPDGRTAACVVNVVLKGIDVSVHQGTVDWAAVKADGVDFAILRSGYGNEKPESQTDATFAANYDGATANGLKVGAYHVSYATTAAEAQQEAQLCLGILNGRKLDYPVYLDVEQPFHSSMQAGQLDSIISTFCNAMIKAGYRAGVYCNTTLLNQFKTISSLSTYDIWVAHPDVLLPNYSGPYTTWQYTFAGSVSGINGAVDMDYSYQEYPLGPQAFFQPSGTAVTDASILSDTGAAITLKVGKTYQFKFTPKNASDKPTFSTGNSSVIKTVYQKKIGASYYYKIQCVRRGCTSVYSTLPKQKAVRRCVVTVV